MAFFTYFANDELELLLTYKEEARCVKGQRGTVDDMVTGYKLSKQGAFRLDIAMVLIEKTPTCTRS